MQVKDGLPDYLHKLCKRAVATCIQFERWCLVAGQWEFESLVIAEQWVGLVRSPSTVLMLVLTRCIKAVGWIQVTRIERAEGGGRHERGEDHGLFEDPSSVNVLL